MGNKGCCPDVDSFTPERMRKAMREFCGGKDFKCTPEKMAAFMDAFWGTGSTGADGKKTPETEPGPNTKTASNG